MNIEALEIELVAQINEYLATAIKPKTDEDAPNTFYSDDYEARILPDNADDFTHAYEKGIVNIGYDNSSYDLNKSVGKVNHPTTMVFSAYIQTDRMRGDKGGYKLLELTINALLGYKPNNASGTIELTGDGGEWMIEDGETRPYVTFKFMTQTMQVRSYDEPALGGQFSELVLNG